MLTDENMRSIVVIRSGAGAVAAMGFVVMEDR